MSDKRKKATHWLREAITVNAEIYSAALGGSIDAVVGSLLTLQTLIAKAIAELEGPPDRMPVAISGTIILCHDGTVWDIREDDSDRPTLRCVIPGTAAALSIADRETI